MTRTKRKSEETHPARGSASASGFWLYGLHAARAALTNPVRIVHRIVCTARVESEFRRTADKTIPIEIVMPEAIGRLLPPNAVHQGIAVLCELLPHRDLAETLAARTVPRLVAVLDQVMDPHNEGAILRSAAAFGVAAVVVQDRHAPPESGTLAKVASGALDIVPRVIVVNIARTLEELGRLGFWRIALTGDGDMTLAEAVTDRDTALVLGGEGSGLRRLVRERCDVTASISTSQTMRSLNVSAAAAVAFYEMKTRTQSTHA